MNLQFDSVHFSHSSRLTGVVPVFQGLSLDVPSGECLGIVGPEGAGKSTLLMLAAGLLHPSAGEIRVWKGTAPGLSPPSSGREIAITFQIPEQQFFCHTVREELESLAVARGGTPDQQRIDTALGAVGLPPREFGGRSPFTLSMGEGRRLSMALLTLQDPALALLDDPTAGLDGEGVRSVIRQVISMRERGSTVVVVSHDLDFIAETATRILILVTGTITADGPAPQVLTDRTLLGRIGFGLPAAAELAEKARRLGADIPARIPSAEILRAAFAALRRP